MLNAIAIIGAFLIGVAALILTVVNAMRCGVNYHLNELAARRFFWYTVASAVTAAVAFTTLGYSL